MVEREEVKVSGVGGGRSVRLVRMEGKWAGLQLVRSCMTIWLKRLSVSVNRVPLEGEEVVMG